MFRTVPLSIIRSFFHCKHNNGICHRRLLTACDQDQDGTGSCTQAVSKPVLHVPLLCVQWRTPDDGQRNCPKYIEFHSKNKSEKLVRLVGFIIRTFFLAIFLFLIILILYLSYTSRPLSLTLSPSAPLSPHSFSHSNPNILRPLTFIKNGTSVRPSFHFIWLYHTWSSLCSSPSFTSIWTMGTSCVKSLRLTCTNRYYTLNCTHTKIYDELLHPRCQNRTYK